jgi:hypothetical protein
VDALTLQPARRSLEHALRQIECMEFCVEVRAAKNDLAMPAIPTARVEDALAAGNVEGVRFENTARKKCVPRQKPGHAREFARHAVVLMLDESSVLRERLVPMFFGFQRFLNRNREGILFVGCFGESLLGFHFLLD